MTRPPVAQASLFPEAPLVPCADQAFDVFWRAYPRKVAKGDARKAWPSALARAGSVQVMLDTIAVWLDEWLSRPQFIPYPATWLRADRWTDGPPVRRVVERRLSSREQAFAAVARRVGAL